jgi:glutamate dehydrogenase
MIEGVFCYPHGQITGPSRAAAAGDDGSRGCVTPGGPRGWTLNEAPVFETRSSLLARAQVFAANEPSFSRFLKAATEATDAEDLGSHSPDVLEALWREAYERLGNREQGRHRVYFLPPADVGHREIIEVFSADMPFIVDSVLAAIRAKGGTIRFMSHPILIFDPATNRVLERPASGTRAESFLHIHIDPLPDAETREGMLTEIDETMRDVARTVAGWRPMLTRVQRVIQAWHDNPPKAPPPSVAEAMHFLGWLAEHNFTFLGMREYRIEMAIEDGSPQLVPIEESGLGILEDPDFKFLRFGTDYVEMTEQHVAFLAEPEPLMVTKANLRSRVHRRSHMDYVGVKLYDELGGLSGELRILGLFTSASLDTPNIDVPLVRKKITDVLRRAGLPPQSHAGKALMAALENYPRDELFQIDDALLYEFATTIATLGDRPRVRVLSRIDRFDNFVSILLFMPRERYDSDVRARIGDYLARVYDGRVSAYYPNFPEGDLVRVHFIIGRNGGPTPNPSRRDIEDDVTELTLTFGDRLRRASEDPAGIGHYLDAFSQAYQSRNTPEEALPDIEVLKGLADPNAMALRLSARPGGGMRLKVYHRETPIALSDRVPMLENFGFRVIDERTYTVEPRIGGKSFIHDMELEAGPGVSAEGDLGVRIENAVIAVWRGDAESDGLNALTATAGLSWYDVEILRALTRYLKQVGISFSRGYLTGVLAGKADVATSLVTLFHALNDPGFAGHRDRAAQAARDTIATALEATASLDEDRIIRRYLNLVEAVVRTNAYQRDAAGDRRPALALKLDCSKVDQLPEPKPYREIFVYSPRVEGLHLRFGPIARGGIRWSDRPEDFRTEVLGLVKAQQVKNAIIVPVGAKGAFVPKRMPPGADRETTMREGTACYKVFISTLLDVTDNIEGDLLMPPPDVRRRDGDDPYLVVAADKGTATFSDTANAIAIDRGFWLFDAFASGGSAGYDHKKMGITARGAWEAVKRHFRELNRDIQTEPFTAVGVGDMSGDVFGNGMLLSPQMRLVAAFDHRDIFIDPDPDPARSMAERARLFMQPRSSWQDYDKETISKGGGIYSRSLKSVPLFAEARKLLGLTSEQVTPNEVIAAILKADADLLFFGGIGTYIRASTETDAEVGDKANDAVRITGKEIRAKVVGEGANLAMTQRGRVEYALGGGRLNTDAIDNSAGVNSSDLEVNIKIALGTLVRAEQLTIQVRNEFLASMTDEVAELCLRNNYLQSLAISVAEQRGLAEFPDHVSLIEALGAKGLLQRHVEFLPTGAQLAERAASGRGLTRPELAVLLAYAKNAVYADLLKSTVPDDIYLSRELYRYFPPKLVDTFLATVSGHRLRREVIATVLSNAMINRGGPAFINEITTATSADAGQVAAAYVAARDIFGLTDYNAAIDTLDTIVPGPAQNKLYAEIEALLARETLWLLRNESFEQGLAPLVERYAEGVGEIKALLPGLVPAYIAGSIETRANAFEQAGVPREIARRIAELAALSMATDIVLVAQKTGASVIEAATAFFAVLDVFGLGRIIEGGTSIVLADRFDRMALDRALANLMRAQRDLSADVLGMPPGDIAARLAAWREARPAAIERAVGAVKALTDGEITVSRLSVAAGLLADLARSA